MAIWIIYKITCKQNGKIYVGQHKTENVNDGYMGSGKLIKRAIEKHGLDKFEKEILCECYDRKSAGEQEEYWIETLGATDPDIGYNITKYAWGGQPHTEETRRKLSEISKGKPKSEQFKNKLKKPKSAEAVNNMKLAAQKARDGRIGKKWYNNPLTNESKQFNIDEQPNGWIEGRGNTQKVGSERKPKTYSEQALKNIIDAAKKESKRNKISKTLTGHEVSNETRDKISNSLKEYYEKNGDNQEN